MLIDIPDEKIEHFRKIAAKSADWENDEFEVYGYCGGNVDDAYERGEEQGEIQMARVIVAIIDGQTP